MSQLHGISHDSADAVVMLTSMMSPVVVPTLAIMNSVMGSKLYEISCPNIAGSLEGKSEPSCKRWLEDHSLSSSSGPGHASHQDSIVAISALPTCRSFLQMLLLPCSMLPLSSPGVALITLYGHRGSFVQRIEWRGEVLYLKSTLDPGLESCI